MHPETQKYFGKFRGVVKDNNDPLQLGRVRCHVPEVLGHNIFTNWASNPDRMFIYLVDHGGSSSGAGYFILN